MKDFINYDYYEIHKCCKKEIPGAILSKANGGAFLDWYFTTTYVPSIIRKKMKIVVASLS